MNAIKSNYEGVIEKAREEIRSMFKIKGTSKNLG